MAKKSVKQKKGLKYFIKDERFRISMGAIFIFFSVILLLSFVSYFFTWKTDQSFEWESTLSASDIQIENWAGRTGAKLAIYIIRDGFGIASFTIPFLLIIIGLRLFNIRVLPLRKTLRITLVGAILLSAMLAYVSGNTNGYLGSGLGGSHGVMINKWLQPLLGKTGTGLLFLIAIFIYIILSFESAYVQLKNFFRKEKTHFSPEKNEEKKIPEKEILHEPDFTASIMDNEPDDYLEHFEIKDMAPHNHNVKKEEPSEKDVELTVEEKNKEELVKKEIKQEISANYDPTLDLSNYQFPPFSLMEDHKTEGNTVSKEELISNKNKIVETLANYKIQIDKIKATIGPTVTLYEIVPAPGIRISKIKNLEDDIALSLAALGIRIIAPIPGKGTIGIEVPNQNPEIVPMKNILASRKFQEAKFELPVAIGKTIANETFVFDLTKMPHLLVAGATGQGKSVGLNAIITSILYKKHPAQVKFVMIDPKKVELTLYAKIERHFLAKLPDTEEAIITDTQKVINTLNSLTIEMDSRYDLLKKAHVRNIKEYNAKFIARNLSPEKGHKYLPYIVVIIDEFADFIMTAGKEVEMPLARLAQLARAIGIHLIIATQRPTTNIITGMIKANFPARIAFRVISMVDSRTILDSPGANQLIGRGDMLISSGSDLVRLQCAFIDTDEIERITEFIGSQQAYPSAYYLPEYKDESSHDMSDVDLQKKDELFEEAARLVVIHQQGSTSLIQRKFSIGYNRAGRIIDQLEAAGIVGPFEGSKARQVLFADEYSLEQYLKSSN